MKKIIILLVVFIVVFLSCEITPDDGDGTDSTTDNTNPTYEFTGITYRYELDGMNINYIADYNFTEVQRSIGAGDSITDVSEIPGVGKVVETEGGKYYMESGTTFVEITLPTGTTTLHIHQFSRYTIVGINYIYYGVDDKLYREAFANFDNHFNGTLVIDGLIFNSAADTIKTNLHYIVDTDDTTDDSYPAGTVRYWPGDSGNEYYAIEKFVNYNTDWSLVDRMFEFISNSTVSPFDDTVVNGSLNTSWTTELGEDVYITSSGSQLVRDKLHMAYISVDSSGKMNDIYSSCDTSSGITFDNITSLWSTSLLTNYSGIGWGQSEQMSTDILINNRMNINSDDWYINASKFYIPRDTMFRQFRDHLVYTEFETERMYLCFDLTGTDLVVEIMKYNNGTVTSSGSFTIAFEDGHLIPNMWADTNGDVYVIVGNILYLYDASNNYTSSTVYTHGDRLDVLTVLPDGNVIVIDANGNLFNTDGSAYTGDNIISQY